jgi:IS5 family transposase
VFALQPHYPNSDKRSSPPIGLERMLRMYVVQQCFGLSDEGMEDAIYDGQTTIDGMSCPRCVLKTR